jgi:hypothetical protein
LDPANAPAQIEEATTPDACLTWCFRQLRARFATAVVFLFDQNQNQLQPWKWDNSAKADKVTALELNSPSLFRIATRTMRPYHGYVVDNPVHQAFFSAWGFKALPKHVTGIPIISNKTLRGFVLCIAADANPPADSLTHAEKSVDRAIRRMEQVPSPLGALPKAKAS